MKTWIGLAALTVVIGASSSYALDPTYDNRDYTVASPIGSGVEGDVVRIDPDSYVIRDASGRDARVYFDRGTTRENIALGDHVVVMYDRPSAPYAASIVRRAPTGTAPVVGALPRPQTIEGEVQRINSDSYVIRDLTGHNVRLHVDRSTQLDGNLSPGDKVVARVVAPPADAPYAQNIYKLNSEAIEGQAVAIDSTTYVVRDSNGIDHRIYADNSTLREKNIIVGDRVVVLRSNPTMAHAESITKR